MPRIWCVRSPPGANAQQRGWRGGDRQELPRTPTRVQLVDLCEDKMGPRAISAPAVGAGARWSGRTVGTYGTSRANRTDMARGPIMTWRSDRAGWPGRTVGTGTWPGRHHDRQDHGPPENPDDLWRLEGQAGQPDSAGRPDPWVPRGQPARPLAKLR
jgi:hypothetical protein